MSGARAKLVRILVFCVVWGVLGLFLTRMLDRLPSRAEWAEVLAQGGGPAMGVFALCFALAMLVRAVRFGFLTRLSVDLPWQRLLVVFPWLFMLGAITPFRLGEGMRVHWVNRQGGSAAKALGNWAAERWTDLAILAGFLILGIAGAPIAGFNGSAVALLGGAVVGGYVLFWLGRSWLIAAAQHLPVARAPVVKLLQSFAYMSDLRLHLTVLVLTLTIWALMATGFWAALSLILDQPVPVILAIACVAAVNLIALISATPGNLVSFQAAMIVVLEAWGFDTLDALMASVVIQSSNLLVAISLGLLSWVLQNGARVRRARH